LRCLIKVVEYQKVTVVGKYSTKWENILSFMTRSIIILALWVR